MAGTWLQPFRDRMIGIDDFIAMQIIAGGPRDIKDVRGVLKLSRELVNLDLVKRLTARSGPRSRRAGIRESPCRTLTA